MQRLRGWEFVYVIQGDEETPIKVGRAIDVAARVRGLQTGNPQRLRVLHAMPGDSHTEAVCHRHLRFSRVLGEWFDGPAVAPFIERFGLYSDQLIQRFLIDRTPPEFHHFSLPAPKVPSASASRLRSPAGLGHSWRTKLGRQSEIHVRHVAPDPVSDEEYVANLIDAPRANLTDEQVEHFKAARDRLADAA